MGKVGVGKSRLFYEFTPVAPCPWLAALASHSVSYGKATAYLPILRPAESATSDRHPEDRRPDAGASHGQLLTLDRALRSPCSSLAGTTGGACPTRPEWQARDPPQRRRRTLDAVKHLLLRESQVQPLLLVFEDLHWIDTETQALLDSLVESLPTARLLLLVNYRPEYHHGWGSKTYYTQLRLDPLPPASADRCSWRCWEAIPASHRSPSS